MAQQVVLPEPQDVARMVEELEDVDGMLGVRTGFYEGQDGAYVHSVNLLMVRDHPAAMARRQRLLRRLVPDGRFEEPVALEDPPCSLERPRALDWRIIQALVERPDLALRTLAKQLRVSWKTVRRHYDRLLDTGALLYGPVLDRSRFPGISLAVVCDGPNARNEVSDHLESRFRYYLPYNRWTLFPGTAYGDPNVIRLTVPVRTPAEADMIAGEIRGWHGVVRALRAQLTGGREYTHWVRQRIDGKVAESRPRPVPPRFARARRSENVHRSRPAARPSN